MKKLFLCVVLIGLVGLLGSGCAQKVESNMVATVNGAKITKDDVERETKTVPFSAPLLGRAGFAVEQQKKIVLLNLIETTLIKQEADKNGIKIADKQIEDRYKTFRVGRSKEELVKELNRMGVTEESLLRYLERQLTKEKLFDKVIKPRKVTEDEMRKYYNRNKAKFKGTSYKDAKVLILPRVSRAKQAKAEKEWLDKVKTNSDIRLYAW